METSRRIHRNAAQLSLHGRQLDNVNTHRHLGVVLSSDLRWTAHVETSILAKVTSLLGVLKRLSSSLNTAALRAFYKMYMRLRLEYSSVVWANLPGPASQGPSGAAAMQGSQNYPAPKALQYL